MKSYENIQALVELNSEVEKYKGSSYSAPFIFNKPRIAVSANLNDQWGSTIALPYTDAVIKAGGIPVVIPVTNQFEILRSVLEECDGLLLSGGDDINPLFLGEDPISQLGDVNTERDRYDFALIRIAAELCIPVLGICRGEQIMAVAFGCEMYQDIYTQRKGLDTLGHNPKIKKTEGAHWINVDGKSRLAKILNGKNENGEIHCHVNSIHHQAVKNVCPPFVVCATANDDIIEAIDAYPELNMLGVQWHPEQLVKGGIEQQILLFKWLVEEAFLYHRARSFHHNYLTLDSHTDTPMKFTSKFNFGDLCSSLVDLPKMRIGELSAVCMVAYLPQKELTPEGTANAKQRGIQILEEIHRQVDLNKNQCTIASDVNAIVDAHNKKLKAIIPAVENGYMIDSLSLLQKLKKLGVVYITLCHNGDNHICDSARKSVNLNGGLSDFGKELVKEMNRLGIMVDISHAAPSTVTDVIELSSKPIIASHSSVKVICNHGRNLTDEQIKAIASKGGVIQICLYAGFINNDETKASLLDVVEHIKHVVDLCGVDYVGIGSDFDGDGELIGCRNTQQLIRLTIELLRAGYSESDLKKIWGDNFLRVMKANEV